MLKMMVLLARRPGLSTEEFRRYWVEAHAPLVQALPGLGPRFANTAPKILSHRRRPVPISNMGPGLRREDEERKPNHIVDRHPEPVSRIF